MMRSRVLFVVAAATFVAAPAASDAQLTPVDPACDFWMGINILNQFVPAAQACAGAFAGNDVQQMGDVLAQIQDLGWGATPEYLGTTDAGESDGPFSSVSSGPDGTVVFNTPLSGNYVFILKAANRFSMYYFENLVGATELSYVTMGTSVNRNGKPQGLSHASLIAVPEPGTLLLMATGLAAVFGLAWRRRERNLA